MDTLRGMGLTIGEFAENLMKTGAVTPTKGMSAPVRKPSEPIYEQRDISKIEVPDSFMKQILGNKYVPQRKPNKVVKQQISEQTKTQPIQLLNEEKMDELLSLLRDVRGLLIEMTNENTVGSFGVGPQSKSKIFRSVLNKKKRSK